MDLNVAIMLVDVVGSTALKVKLGDRAGGDAIAEVLKIIEDRAYAADPEMTRDRPSAGDDLLIISKHPFDLFMMIVDYQRWQRHKTSLAVRVALLYGRYEDMPDGQFRALRGASIDLGKAILGGCRPGGVVISASMQEVVRGAGYGMLLVRREITLKDGTTEHFFAVAEDTDHRNREPLEMTEPQHPTQPSPTNAYLTQKYFEDRMQRIEDHLKASDSRLETLHTRMDSFLSGLTWVKVVFAIVFIVGLTIATVKMMGK